ncbi:MAG: glycosyltransferase 87 family protein [Hyphomicrobiales bacterium]|nr:glycosyltransferase 87 family protein [Hyphomicrobiales bacterium]
MPVFGLPQAVVTLGIVLTTSMGLGTYLLYNYLHGPVVVLTLIQGVIYVALVWLLLRTRTHEDRSNMRRGLILILLLAGVMRLCVLFAPPVSTDIYRYVWDGRVQASGVNPYEYVPADPALAALRDQTIYPHINRKEYARTIYPPVAQGIYWAATRLSETVTMMKAVMVGFEALTVWALIQLLIARGLPLNRVLIYAWHPLPVWEIAGSGHIDAAAIAFMLLAFVAAQWRRPLLAGAALGAGVGVKFLPIIAAPALYRLWDWRLPAALIATVAAGYAIYASAGAKIFGFFGGYADEQGLSTGAGFYLWSLFQQAFALPSGGLLVFLGAALAALGLLAARSVFWRKNQPLDIETAFLIMAVFTLVISPHHAWYLLWLTPFLVFYPSPAVLYVTLAAGLLYRLGWPPDVARASILYGPFALLLVWEFYRRFTIKEAHNDSAIHTARSA